MRVVDFSALKDGDSGGHPPGFLFHRWTPAREDSRAGLVPAPQASTASPAALMLIVALISRSCRVPQRTQAHSRTCSGDRSRVVPARRAGRAGQVHDYIYYGLERQGARGCRVASPDGMTLPLELMLGAIDEETQLVSVSHVAFRSSFVQDLAAITHRAHRVGALVIADLYQSAGILPVDVRALGVDFATGGSVKWLCGGPGAGYLYVRADLLSRLHPAATGWMAHHHPFEFEPGPIDYAADA